MRTMPTRWPLRQDVAAWQDVPLLTELGAVSWATPMALPALGQRPRRLDRSERYESGSDAATRPRSALRCRSRLALGCRVAALVGGGPVGLLGPVAKVPQEQGTNQPSQGLYTESTPSIQVESQQYQAHVT